MKLSKRLDQIKPSATLAVAAKAAELKSQGIDVINMGTGEPDFATPEHIKQAAITAINNNQTRYTPVDGTVELKTAIIAKLKRDNKLNYTPEKIIVSNGAKHSLFNALTATLNRGDEVIIPVPYWVSYPDMVQLCGGKPVIIATDHHQGFKITPEQLKQTITTKTKAIILNSPTNPTGMVYSETELQGLAEVLLKHPEIFIITDDIYEHIMWNKHSFCNIINACPELYDRTILINGVSKAYAMTGWRIGFAAGPHAVIKAMKKVQSQSTSGPSSISQAAAAAAFSGDQSCLKPMVQAFHERHDMFVKGINKIPGFDCLPAHGAFYLFPHVQAAIDKLANINNDVEFANYLLEKAHIATVPGSAFGAPGYLRLSYACSTEQIQEVLTRIKAALA